MTQGVPPVPTKTELKQLILELVSLESGKDFSLLIAEVAVDLSADDVIDSLALVSIAVDLEDRLGVRLRDGELTPSHLRSLESFADFMLAKVAELTPAGAQRTITQDTMLGSH